MKTLLILGLFSILTIQNISAQTESVVPNDAILKVIKPVLPKGWIMYPKEDLLIVESTDTVFVLFENQINAPVSVESKSDRVNRIKKYGKPQRSRIVYHFENKWSVEKIKEYNAANEAIYSKLKKLPEKHGITNLKDRMLSNKMGDVYVGKTEKEKKLVENYNKEKKELESQIKLLPNYHTELYSLFLIETTGCYDDMHLVTPESISTENYQVQTLFRELCGK